MIPPPLSPLEQAQALSHTYALLARLYREGFTQALLPYVRQLPDDLPQLFKAPPDFEQLAAAHHSMFGMNVFPFASMFLDEQQLLGGVVSNQFLAFYDEVGFVPGPDEEADHIAQQLSVLAFLSGAEADALEDGQQAIAARIQSLILRFMTHYLLRWVPLFVQSVRQQGDDRYTALAEVTLHTICGHHERLAPNTPIDPADFSLPAPPAILDDEKTGLRQIAAYLLNPVYSGVYLSRDDIARLARPHDLPRGFGSRLDMLTDLLRAAVRYNRLDALLHDVQGVLHFWHTVFTIYRDVPTTLSDIAPIWLNRIEDTQALLERVSAEAATFAGDDRAREDGVP